MTYVIWKMDMVAKGTKGIGTSQQSLLNAIKTFVENTSQPWRNIYSHAEYAEITPFSVIFYVPVPGVGIVGINDTGLITSVNGMPIAAGPGSNLPHILNALTSAYAPPMPTQPPAPPRPQPTQPTQASPRPTAPIEVLPATPTPPPPPPTAQQQPPRFIEELLVTHPPTAPQPPPSIQVMLPMLTPPRRVAGLALW